MRALILITKFSRSVDTKFKFSTSSAAIRAIYMRMPAARRAIYYSCSMTAVLYLKY
eukprot:SAG31_NODE_42044_length_273_cov_0.867816_1_plen_55_part_10